MPHCREVPRNRAMTHPASRHHVVDRLAVEIHATRAALGRASARAAGAYLRGVIAREGEARVVFGSAPSQDEFIAALIDRRVAGPIDWSRVTVYHMDEYVGLAGDRPESFRSYLREHLLRHVPVGTFHPIAAEEPDSAAVCARYAAWLSEKPIDLVCLGFGENGHIAFNDPAVADFDDPALVKVVELDAACRQQQVNDGCFPSLDAVPARAITVTITVFRQARRLTAQVPGARKAAAVRAALRGSIATDCPASILRAHPNATLYLELESASQL